MTTKVTKELIENFDANVKAGYEANADTNVFTDDNKYNNEIVNAVTNAEFTGIGTVVAVSNIYEPFLESDWPLMMQDKSWYDEEGYGVDGAYHSTVTTTERDALTPSMGDVCYNSTTSTFQKYSGSSWATTYRGNTREFPARAVAVAEATKVIIYDLTQSAPVMWMVFIWSGTYNLLGYGDRPATSVSLKGGKLFRGSSTLDGMYVADFLNNRGYRITIGANEITSDSIKDRHGFTGFGDSLSSEFIVNNAVNDIATTQLDNAPVDEYGVKAVTVAVATDGGVSVIRDDGNVWDLTHTVAVSNESGHVEFLDKGIRWTSRRAGYYVYVQENYSLPSADNATAPDGLYSYLNNPVGQDLELLFNTDIGASTSALSKGAIGILSGLALLKENTTAPAKGLINYLTTSYQSGWMAGDIKGAWLADNDDTDAVGGELVTNGTFDTDTTGWTSADATLSIDTARLKVTNTIASSGRGEQLITVVIGKIYTLNIDIIAGTDNGTIRLGSTGSNIDYKYETNKTTGSYIYTITAITTTLSIGLQVATGGASDTCLFDNITCKLADADRSVNNNGLQVNGTITKTRLGGDDSLVAYSGFSASNYLEQPYNADLDFGTGDFYIMGWHKGTDSNGTILDRDDLAESGNGYALYISNNVLGFLRLITTSTSTIATSVVNVNDNVLRFFSVIRRDGVVYFYVNGVLASKGSNTTNYINTSAVMRIGVDRTGVSGLSNSSLALMRMGAGAPTAEDIEYIYKQEKPLIVNGADAVLGGSSDAIESLSWDEYKKQLYVQSGDTQSVLQGSTVIKTTASTDNIVVASDGEVVSL